MARYQLRMYGRVYDEHTARSFGNLDHELWNEYQSWLAGGGVPDPIPPDPLLSPAEQAARDEAVARRSARDALRADSTVDFLRTHTPAECAAWVQTNVTDLAAAKNVLAKLAMICAYLARERLSMNE